MSVIYVEIRNNINRNLYRSLTHAIGNSLKTKDASEIHLSIESEGGSAFWAHSMLHFLRKVARKRHLRIVTYASREVCSAANYVFMAGDECVVMPGARFMQHPARQAMTGWTEADYSKAIEERQMKNSMKRFFMENRDRMSFNRMCNLAIYQSYRPGIDADEVSSWLHRETWFNDVESLDKGIADRLGERPPGWDKARILLTGIQPAKHDEQRSWWHNWAITSWKKSMVANLTLKNVSP